LRRGWPQRGEGALLDTKRGKDLRAFFLDRGKRSDKRGEGNILLSPNTLGREKRSGEDGQRKEMGEKTTQVQKWKNERHHCNHSIATGGVLGRDILSGIHQEKKPVLRTVCGEERRTSRVFALGSQLESAIAQSSNLCLEEKKKGVTQRHTRSK